jgi:hypothetical protein
MPRRTQLGFLSLVLAQAAHSVEEYVTRLYAVFGPAAFVSSLVSRDLRRGFLIANLTLVAVGAVCYALPVRLGWTGARAIVAIWVAVELLNGCGHLLFAALRGGYFPGAVTAPLLLATALWTARTLAAPTDPVVPGTLPGAPPAR